MRPKHIGMLFDEKIIEPRNNSGQSRKVLKKAWMRIHYFVLLFLWQMPFVDYWPDDIS